MPKSYDDGSYWRRRRGMMYYKYLGEIVRRVGADAASMLDVGSGNAPYLDWFWWIDKRISFDRAIPYSSKSVEGIRGDLMKYDFGRRFDLVTCFQVLEHVSDPAPFARRLLALGDLVLVSVPFNWPKGRSKHHVNDPVDVQKLTEWFGRPPNWTLVAYEPFVEDTSARIFALFDPDPGRVFTRKTLPKSRSAEPPMPPRPRRRETPARRLKQAVRRLLG